MVVVRTTNPKKQSLRDLIGILKGFRTDTEEAKRNKTTFRNSKGIDISYDKRKNKERKILRKK